METEAGPGEHFQCYCGELDPATTAQELQQLFGSVGPCTVSLRRGSRRVGGGGAAGYAYIAYGSAEEAAAAVERLNRFVLHGRSLRVMPRLPAAMLRGQQGAAGGSSWGSAGCTLHIQGLAPSVGPGQLQQYAAAFGHVMSATVATDDRGASLGVGECVFASEEAAMRAAVAWQGACPLGPQVSCELAPLQQAQRSKASPQRRRSLPKPAVVVRGLSPDTAADQLLEVFSAAGTIKRLRLVVNEEGRSAGVAFVTFLDHASMHAALALGANLVIDGQQPTVAPAHRDLAPEQQQQQQQQAQQAVGASRPPSAAVAAAGRPAGQPQAASAGPHGPQAAPMHSAFLKWQDGATVRAPADPWHWQQAPPAAGYGDAPALGSVGGSMSSAQLGRARSTPVLGGGSGPALASFASVGGPMPGGGGGDVSNDTLFARPLGPEVDEATLRQLFAPHNGLVSVKLLRHPDGSSRGCGFVRFADSSQAHAALQALDGALLAGRPVRLSWAQHKQQMKPGGSSGGILNGAAWDWSSIPPFANPSVSSSQGGASIGGPGSYFDPHTGSGYPDGSQVGAMLTHAGDSSSPRAASVGIVPVIAPAGYAPGWMPYYYSSVYPTAALPGGLPPAYAHLPAGVPAVLVPPGAMSSQRGVPSGSMQSWDQQPHHHHHHRWQGQSRWQQSAQQHTAFGGGGGGGMSWRLHQGQDGVYQHPGEPGFSQYQRRPPHGYTSSSDRPWRHQQQLTGSASGPSTGASLARHSSSSTGSQPAPAAPAAAAPAAGAAAAAAAAMPQQGAGATAEAGADGAATPSSSSSSSLGQPAIPSGGPVFFWDGTATAHTGHGQPAVVEFEEGANAAANGVESTLVPSSATSHDQHDQHDQQPAHAAGGGGSPTAAAAAATAAAGEAAARAAAEALQGLDINQDC